MVDAVALPDTYGDLGLVDEDNGDVVIRKGMERLRLMVLAEGELGVISSKELKS